MSHSGSKVHVKDVTAIDPAWLQILAPHYYEKVTLRYGLLRILFYVTHSFLSR